MSTSSRVGPLPKDLVTRRWWPLCHYLPLPPFLNPPRFPFPSFLPSHIDLMFCPQTPYRVPTPWSIVSGKAPFTCSYYPLRTEQNKPPPPEVFPAAQNQDWELYVILALFLILDHTVHFPIPPQQCHLFVFLAGTPHCAPSFDIRLSSSLPFEHSNFVPTTVFF